MTNSQSIGYQSINLLTSRLIDMTKRNRLLYTPAPDPNRRGSLSIVPITKPNLFEVFDLLYSKEQSFKVEALVQDTLLTDDFDGSVSRVNDRHVSLYSSYSSKQLNSSLSNLRDRGRASINERGVNILFAAFGFITWADPASPTDFWRAPIVLLPITIDRRNGGYVIAGITDETLLNPALIYKFSSEYRIQIPEMPDEIDANQLVEYFSLVNEITSKHKNNFHNSIHVEQAVSLGIFSFAKISMFRELIQLGVDKLLEHATIASLVDPNFDFPYIDDGGDNPDLDKQLNLKNTALVVEADSSQLEAIYRSQYNRNLAIQGPPGTGKSQTIVNLIADALAHNKTVLFVAEKRVALDVVHKRLKDAGLGSACLVIHPGKAQAGEYGGSINKKAILDEIERTWFTARPSSKTDEEVIEELDRTRFKLNSYVKELHRPRYACSKSVFDMFGALEIIRDYPDVLIKCEDAASLTISELRQRQSTIDEFEDHEVFITSCGFISPWFELRLCHPSREYISQLKQKLELLFDNELELSSLIKNLSERTGIAWPEKLSTLDELCDFLIQFRLDALSINDYLALQKRFSGKYANIFRFLFKSAYKYDCERLKPFWLKDWTGEPHSVANALELIGRLRQLHHIPENFIVASENLDLSIEAGRIKSLIAELKSLTYDLQELFSIDVVNPLQIDQVANADILDWVEMRLEKLDDVTPCLLFRLQYENPECIPVREFIHKCIDNKIPVSLWRYSYERLVWKTLLELAFNESPILSSFSPKSHERVIDHFRELDRKVIDVGRTLLNSKLVSRRPPISGEASRAASSEVAILLREFRRKRIMPLRMLLTKTHNAILDIKPCFLMSPLTVSQYLDPAVYQFDLVIFDEASQVRMEDAIGSIYRAKQVIVVGDEQQLPPTRFFDAIDSGDDYDEESIQVSESIDFESILTRAESEPRAFRRVNLLWHYRSHNEELIAFSNKNFYNNRLITFPNAMQNGENKAIDFVYVPNAVYDRGGSRTNLIEAKEVAIYCIEFARSHPNWSLGVVTFSEAQRHIIENEIESLLQKNPDVRGFFAEDREGGEPFVVKNLELVQGDERDAIFFSFGYGKDKSGAFSQNFGPLNQEVGRRRLNVAVTRARYKVVLFCSIQPEDLTDSTEGVRLMKEYMVLARDGLAALFGNPITAHSTGDTESPFEDSVAEKLRAKGLEIHTQIGCSGYRIDLGVVDPIIPGRYVIGIECDGASYHSSRTARDRDRLRQQVLEGLGWHIVRIWSRSWYDDPEKEILKVIDAVERYKGKNDHLEPVPIHTRLASTPEEIKIELPEEVPFVTIRDTYPKKFAKLNYSSDRIRIGPTVATAEDLAKLITKQGPTQVNVLIKQITRLWGYKRVGENIRLMIIAAVYQAERDQKVLIDGNPQFVYPISRYPITIRVSEPSSQREVDEIPLEEYHLALWLAIMAAGGSIGIRDAMRIANGLLGFQRLTSEISDRFLEAISQASKIESSLYANTDSPIIVIGDRLSTK